MTQDYWEQRREEIIAYRDYARSFDLAKDMEAGVWLAESGHQLMETAFQLLFLREADDATALAERAVGYYEASLASESSHPATDARMAGVYQRLYYARWWVTGEETPAVMLRAASAFSGNLVRSVSRENTGIYVRAALLWLEAGEVASALPWISVAQESGLREADQTPGAATLMRVLSGLVSGEPRNSTCRGLLEAMGHISAWGLPTAGTLWEAIQVANVHRCLCGADGDFSSLLEGVR